LYINLSPITIFLVQYSYLFTIHWFWYSLSLSCSLWS